MRVEARAGSRAGRGHGQLLDELQKEWVRSPEIPTTNPIVWRIMRAFHDSLDMCYEGDTSPSEAVRLLRCVRSRYNCIHVTGGGGTDGHAGRS